MGTHLLILKEHFPQRRSMKFPYSVLCLGFACGIALIIYYMTASSWITTVAHLVALIFAFSLSYCMLRPRGNAQDGGLTNSNVDMLAMDSFPKTYELKLRTSTYSQANNFPLLIRSCSSPTRSMEKRVTKEKEILTTAETSFDRPPLQL